MEVQHKTNIQAMAVIEATWPKMFDRDHPIPLKIGVHEDIESQLPEIPPPVIRSVMRYWTTRNRYLLSLIDGVHRYDLDGEISGTISDEHRVAAGEMYRVRKKSRQ